ncbi:hypothetical protein TSOC_005972 [Tetrabaena socialis]|uniref:Uncharacterized protein n=1 Tax=Tetrabaena socialis TaxID=47790 RepID=A0A2J8A4W6_9CHLO|nr:hypothetical protein TSOC_005972 [Tetrabaena socialis]|eukprot:PNH07556.1 hypothetical protein TSOC_005972 [Tetrabaena socialis]
MVLALSASACRPLLTGFTQALGSLTGRAAAGYASSSAPSSLPPAPPKKASSLAEPTYTYPSPGSSMREPIYISTTDPVYFVDPKPDATQARAAAAAQAQAEAAAAEERAATAQGQRHKGGGMAPGSLKKIDFSAISGKSDNGKPVSRTVERGEGGAGHGGGGGVSSEHCS